MYPSRRHQSRYLAALRRAHLTRIAAVSAVLVIPAACSSSDAATFADVPTESSAVVDSTDVAAPSTTDGVDTTVGSPATSAPSEPAPASTDLADGGIGEVAVTEMQIDFTYTPEATTGRVQNPYIAVWIEDTDGNLVRTIAVWYQSSIPGPRWLSDLRQWNAVSGGATDASFTGATRAPGSYSLVWDGTDDAGNPLPEGDYVIWIESAREHGPYNNTSATFSVSAGASAVALPDVGELIGASVTPTV